MYRHILVAFDGSAASSNAFDAARSEGVAQTVSTVTEILYGDGDIESKATLDQARRHHTALLQGLKRRSEALYIAPKLEMATRHPARQIFEHAADGQADLVVGHRGSGGFDRWLLGSVAHHVVSHADCAVLVVR